MKRFQLLVIVLLIGCCAGLVYNAINIEWRAKVWQDRANSADALAHLNDKILDAHLYGKDLMQTARILAIEVNIQSEREQKYMQYVVQLEEENLRLKGSLKEAVLNIENQQEEINSLHDELAECYFKIGVFERAMKLSPTPADKTEKAKNAVIDMLDTFGVLDYVAPILNFIW